VTDEERADVCTQIAAALQRGLEIGVAQGELIGRLAMAREIEAQFGLEVVMESASTRLH